MIKKYSITVNGNIYDVEVEELGVQNDQVFRPQTQTKQVQQPQTTQITLQEGGSINAPMPGTINDVYVKVGDSIKKGQVLLILEAMKMENEIMASGDGTVLAINISKGLSVNAGDMLITIG